MNYTDGEILDLETSLESVGLSVPVKLGLVEPDYWDRKEMGTFGQSLVKFHAEELKGQEIILGSSYIIFPDNGKGKSILTIEGPSVRASKILDRLYEKYECQMAFEFAD